MQTLLPMYAGGKLTESTDYGLHADAAVAKADPCLAWMGVGRGPPMMHMIGVLVLSLVSSLSPINNLQIFESYYSLFNFY